MTYPPKLLAIYAVVGAIGGLLFLVGAVVFRYPIFATAFCAGIACGVGAALLLRRPLRFRLDGLTRLLSHRQHA